jgi:ATP-binding protein involved in chromosome partitioning
VAVNIAAALAARGSRVALLDGDIYGPNVPLMLGLKTQLETDGKKILPARAHGLQVVSIGFLTQDDAPVMWRGPMLHGAIQQFFRDVAWDNVDYLIVDMPPGTGDVALSLSQTVPVAGAVLVTTRKPSRWPTRAARSDVSQAQHSTLGLIENMSSFVCPKCGEETDLFGQGGGERLASDLSVPFLGRIPLHAPVRRAAIWACRSFSVTRPRRRPSRLRPPRSASRSRSRSPRTPGERFR